MAPRPSRRGSVWEDASLTPIPGPQEMCGHSRRTEPTSRGRWAPAWRPGSGANTPPAAHGQSGEPPVLSLPVCRTGVTGAAPRPAPGSEARSRAGGVLQERASRTLCSKGGRGLRFLLWWPCPRPRRAHVQRSSARSCPSSLQTPAPPEEAFLPRGQPTGSPRAEEREAGGLQLSKA